MDMLTTIIEQYRRCHRCGGSGRAEMDPGEWDFCYHCTKGRVDAETARADALASVAISLASHEEDESARDNEYYGESLAESGLSRWDFYKARVWSRAEGMMTELLALAPEAQDVLIGWNEQEPEPVPVPSLGDVPQPPPASRAPEVDDGIPF